MAPAMLLAVDSPRSFWQWVLMMTLSAPGVFALILAIRLPNSCGRFQPVVSGIFRVVAPALITSPNTCTWASSSRGSTHHAKTSGAEIQRGAVQGWQAAPPATETMHPTCSAAKSCCVKCRPCSTGDNSKAYKQYTHAAILPAAYSVSIAVPVMELLQVPSKERKCALLYICLMASSVTTEC